MHATPISLIFASVIIIGGAIVVGWWFIIFIKNGGPENFKKTLHRLNTTGSLFTEVYVPHKMRLIEQSIMQVMKVQGEDYKSTIGRFLGSINVHDGTRRYPDYLHNGVVKKMMWEYQKKVGDLNVALNRTDFPTFDEICSPIDPAEKLAFYKFCVDHTK